MNRFFKWISIVGISKILKISYAPLIMIKKGRKLFKRQCYKKNIAFISLRNLYPKKINLRLIGIVMSSHVIWEICSLYDVQISLI